MIYIQNKEFKKIKFFDKYDRIVNRKKESVMIQYTRENIIEKCEAAFKDIKNFYKQPFINFTGKTSDCNEYYTEIIAEFLNDVNLDARQIYFVNQIIEYIVQNGLMKDVSVLQESPFTDRGSIVEIFKDLSIWQKIRGVIEKINMNAAS